MELQSTVVPPTIIQYTQRFSVYEISPHHLLQQKFTAKSPRLASYYATTGNELLNDILTTDPELIQLFKKMSTVNQNKLLNLSTILFSQMNTENWSDQQSQVNLYYRIIYSFMKLDKLYSKTKQKNQNKINSLKKILKSSLNVSKYGASLDDKLLKKLIQRKKITWENAILKMSEINENKKQNIYKRIQLLINDPIYVKYQSIKSKLQDLDLYTEFHNWCQTLINKGNLNNKRARSFEQSITVREQILSFLNLK